MAEYIDREALIKRLDASPLFDNPNDHALFKFIKLGVLDLIEKQPAADVVEVPPEGMGELSDGYHTFNELYHHRAVLFSVICNSMPDRAWKSKLHDTGDMFDGMFIVGIETPQGQATYHYDIDPYWDMFKVQELERAPKWDGHTPEEAIRRIAELSADVVEVVRCKECQSFYSAIVMDDKVFYGCSYMGRDVKPNGFCSYGKRKDGVDNA